MSTEIIGRYVGRRAGVLTVERVESAVTVRRKTRYVLLCRCACGKTRPVLSDHLHDTKSCLDCAAERQREAQRKGGHARAESARKERQIDKWALLRELLSGFTPDMLAEFRRFVPRCRDASALVEAAQAVLAGQKCLKDCCRASAA